MKLDVYQITGKKAEAKIDLPEEIFALKPNEKLMAQAVRVFSANQHQGTASTKTRGEVTGSRRKIWRQKGTGRARHGDRYAPIFVGGGIAHGPKPKQRRLKMGKKMRQKALFSALSVKMKDKAVIVIAGLEKIKPKTKLMAELIENVVQPKAKKILIVLPEKQENIIRAGRNLANVDLIQAKQLNTYEVINHQKIVFMKEAINVLREHFK